MKHLIFIILFFISFNSFQCSSQQKKLTIWIGGSPEEVDFWEQLVKQYEKQTGYSVLLVRQPTYTDQRRQALEISLEAKQPDPDLFLMDVVWINQFARSGWLQSLDSFIKKSNFSTDVFFPDILNTTDKFNDSLFALPVFMDVALLYYRKDLLDQFGFKPPETWDELKMQCLKILPQMKKVNSEFNGFVWQGAQYEGLVCSFLEFTASDGGGIMKNGKFVLYTPENMKALQFMDDLINRFNISPVNTYTEMKEEEVRRTFQRGDALFERNWTYAWNLHQSEDSPVKGKVGLSVLPHFENHESVSSLGGWHIGISKYSDVKNQAWDFIRFVTSYSIQKQLFEKVGWNPGRSDVYKDSTLLKKFPRLKVLAEVLLHTVTRPAIPYYPQFSDIVQRYVNDCLANKIKSGEALKEMQNQVNKLSAYYEAK